MSERLERVRYAVEKSERCKAKHIETTIVHERFQGMPVWDGVVETFQLEGHPTAKLAYAWEWNEASGERREPKYTVVLATPRVNSPIKAVRAAIVAMSKRADALLED